ncbi:fluoride efflux transporter FluC [Corynebacterium suicordis]
MTSPHRSSNQATSPGWRAVLLVFLGGALGVLLSTVVRQLGMGGFGSAALPLLLVNVVGALLLGLLVSLIPDATSRWRLFLGTGFLGGFTSFSAIPASLFPPLRESVELFGNTGEPAVYSDEMPGPDPVMDHSGLEALLLAPVSLVLGVLAAMLGMWIARQLISRGGGVGGARV